METNMKHSLLALGLACVLPTIAIADGAPREDWGRAGILSSANKADLPPITLSSGMPLADAPWVLTSGTYYEFEIEGEELLARVLCHEIDHLEGIVYLDRLSPLRRDLMRRKIKKLIRAGEW